jgi:hypothetical protein
MPLASREARQGDSRMSIDKTSHGVETFRMVPDRLWLDPRLQANDVRLWCALTFTARGRDRTGVSDQGLAKMMGWSPQTVRRSLLRLEECRFIERARRGEGRMITVLLSVVFDSTRRFPLRRHQFRPRLAPRASAGSSTGRLRGTRGSGFAAKTSAEAEKDHRCRIGGRSSLWLMVAEGAFLPQPATPGFQRAFMRPCVVFAWPRIQGSKKIRGRARPENREQLTSLRPGGDGRAIPEMELRVIG